MASSESNAGGRPIGIHGDCLNRHFPLPIWLLALMGLCRLKSIHENRNFRCRSRPTSCWWKWRVPEVLPISGNGNLEVEAGHIRGEARPARC